MQLTLRICAFVLAGIALIPEAQATDSNIGDTSATSHEILFCSGGTAPYTGCLAADLRAKADNLSSPAAIFEYVRNNYDFSLYQGARSGSVNTFLGERGNDVDLAATLIAMLRSQGIPAHYVVGTVRVPATQVMNWLQVEDPTLAKSLLVDQGIQKVVSSTSGLTPTLDFEHVWVEALVPYGQYRGEVNTTVNCSILPTPSVCHWVPMDPSWKQYVQQNSGLDPYSTLSFDYTSYYNAIVNADATRLNKNPLEIYQEQVLSWLSTNAPGKTLDDIPDFQGIVTQTNGLLPDSLPYPVVGSTARIYNSVADHDIAVPATEPKNWGKTATITTYLCPGVSIGSFTNSLVDLATHKLTSTVDTSGGTIAQVWRLDSVPIAGGSISGFSSITCDGQLIVPAQGTPYSFTVQMQGPPDPTGGSNDYTITANYQAVMGGYYLLATGGESSNWSQVHRAAAQLLAANTQYPIVFDSTQSGCNTTTGYGCTTAYVGSVAPANALTSNLPAMDALTGGLLYVASTQYFAQLRDDFTAAGRLNKVVTPIAGFLGVVSSTYQPAEYINSTAFGILPSGLLIDMKGITMEGSWRINAPATYSNNQIVLDGHITSSLEHETWQQLTGYDAISTVRGIQMALANSATLLDIMKNQTTDTMATAYTAFGFANAVPNGYAYTPFNLFGTQPATWINATDGAGIDIMLPQISTSTPLQQQSLEHYVYHANSGLYGWVNCVNGDLTYLNTLSPTLSGGFTFCDGVAVNDTVANIITKMKTDYLSSIIPMNIGQSYFNFLDIAQGFTPASYLYRTTPIAANAQFSSFVEKIRNNLYLQDMTKVWEEYLTPTIQSVGPNYKFAVDINYVYDTPTGNIAQAAYEILNNTGIVAGGGFVTMPPIAEKNQPNADNKSDNAVPGSLHTSIGATK